MQEGGCISLPVDVVKEFWKRGVVTCVWWGVISKN